MKYVNDGAAVRFMNENGIVYAAKILTELVTSHGSTPPRLWPRISGHGPETSGALPSASTVHVSLG